MLLKISSSLRSRIYWTTVINPPINLNRIEMTLTPEAVDAYKQMITDPKKFNLDFMPLE